MNTLGVWTVFKKETARFREVWTQTLIAPVVSNALFMMIFGVAFAGREGSSSQTFLAALIPGLAAMGIMMNALQNPMGSLIVAKYTNTIGELLTIPLRGFEVAVAYIGASVLRGVLVGAVTVLVGFFFAPVTFVHPLIIVLFAFLLGGTFASIGTICGALFNDFDQMAMVQNFIVTPLVYLGGVFFSISALPGVVGQIARFNPVFYLIDGFRYGFIGHADARFALALTVAIVFFLATFSIASWIFHTGYKLKT